VRDTLRGRRDPDNLSCGSPTATRGVAEGTPTPGLSPLVARRHPYRPLTKILEVGCRLGLNM
jgi:hypothetical protein